MDKMQKRSKKVLEEFGKIRSKKWTPEAMLVDLTEEVGELANSILVKEGFKNKKRAKADLMDSICDILFDLYMIAEHYGIDVEKEYLKVLENLQKRIKQGDFVD